MPAIRLFGRRWNAASDDFVYPGIIEIVTRTAWMIVLLAVYILEAEELDRCHNGSKVEVFYIGTVVLLMAYFVVNVSLVTLSGRGYIMDPLPRRHVPTLLYVKLALLAPEIAWTILGTLWTFQLEHDCRQLPVILGKTIVVIEWVILCLVIISMYLMFDPLGKRHVKKRSLKDYNKMWRARCRVLCCCILQDENRREAFEEITELLSNFFRGRDYVLSDVLAGIVLLSLKQKHQDRHQVKVPLSEAPTLPLRVPRGYVKQSEAISLKRSVGTTDSRNTNNSLRGRSTSLGEYNKRTPEAPWLGELNKAFQPDTDDVQKNQDVSGVEKGTLTEDAKLFDSTRSNNARSYGSSDAAPTTTGARTEYPTGGDVPRSKAKLSNSTSVASTSSSYSDNVFYPLSPPVGPKTWMTLENCTYYLRIATAIYGSSNYSGCYNCSDRIPLCKKYRWRNTDQHLPSSVIQGDNWWECEVSSVMLYGGFSRGQIIYASLDNQIFKTPYVIVRDDAKKNVVIAIRGTMSAGDALTDLTAQGENIYEENMPRGNVHKGVLKVARKMVQQLATQVHLQNNVPRGYGLVVTGHSLGAGVAAILALLLKNEYPDVVCFAFSPPGGLVSHPLSVFMQDFTLTLFLGMDVVPRLGVITMEKLKSDLMVVIKNSRVPKYKIVSSGVSAFCCGWKDSHATDLLIEDAMTKRLTESMYQEICRDAHDTDSLNGSSISDSDSMYQEMGPGVLSKEDSFCSSTTDQESENTDAELPAYKSDDKHRPLSVSSSFGYDGTLGQELRRSPRTGSGVRKTDSRPVSTSHAKWRNKQKKIKKGLAATEPLLLPGQILYLYEDEDLSTYGCCTSNPIYRTRWARPEEFNQVILDSKMMNHHNPYTIKDALEQILEQEGFLGDACSAAVVESQPNGGSPFTKPYAFGAQSSIKEVDEKDYYCSDYPDDESVIDHTFTAPRGDVHVVDISTEKLHGVHSNVRPISGESKDAVESHVIVNSKEIEHILEMEKLCLSFDAFDVEKSYKSEQGRSEVIPSHNADVDSSMLSNDLIVNNSLTYDDVSEPNPTHIIAEDNSYDISLTCATTIVSDAEPQGYTISTRLPTDEFERNPADRENHHHDYFEPENMKPDCIEPGHVEDQALNDHGYSRDVSEANCEWHGEHITDRQPWDELTSESTDVRDVFSPRISPVSAMFNTATGSHVVGESHAVNTDGEDGYDSSSESSEVGEQSACRVLVGEENQRSDLNYSDSESHSSESLEPGRMFTHPASTGGVQSCTDNGSVEDCNAYEQQCAASRIGGYTGDDTLGHCYSSAHLQEDAHTHSFSDHSTESAAESVNNEEGSAEPYRRLQYTTDVELGNIKLMEQNTLYHVDEVPVTPNIPTPNTTPLVLEHDEINETPESQEHPHQITSTVSTDGQSLNKVFKEVEGCSSSPILSEDLATNETSSSDEYLVNEAEYPMETGIGDDTYFRETVRGKYSPHWTDLALPGDDSVLTNPADNKIHDYDIGCEAESSTSVSSDDIVNKDSPAAISSQKRFIHIGDDSDEYTPGITI